MYSFYGIKCFFVRILSVISSSTVGFGSINVCLCVLAVIFDSRLVSGVVFFRFFFFLA